MSLRVQVRNEKINKGGQTGETGGTILPVTIVYLEYFYSYSSILLLIYLYVYLSVSISAHLFTLPFYCIYQLIYPLLMHLPLHLSIHFAIYFLIRPLTSLTIPSLTDIRKVVEQDETECTTKRKV